MEHKLLSTLAISCLTMLAHTGYGQETTSLDLGYNLLKNKAVVDFQFNRTAPEDAKSSFDIKLVHKSFVLNPAAEAHIGAGNDASPNNIIALANMYYKNVLPKKEGSTWVWYYQINVVSPELASDKDFRVYQGYTAFGGSLMPTYKMPSGLGDIQLDLSAFFNYGFSKSDTLTASQEVSRFKLNPTFHWYFIGVNHTPANPPELDPDFYYKFGFSIALTQYNFLKQDERIIDKKSLGYFTASFSYRFTEHLKITTAYKRGRLEPLYKDVNTLTLGIALVQ